MDTPLPSKVTIRDLAKRLQLSHATVSMALRDNPNIAIKTRQRVKEEAERSGYRPEPMLSALAAYRQMKKPSIYHGTIAWLFNNYSRSQMLAIPLYRQYFEGACWRANGLGYQVEEYSLKEPDVGPARMSNILQARGVQGILLPPQPRLGGQLDMRWDLFSTVAFGFSFLKPQLHVISSTQYRNSMMAVQCLRDLGYERIGFFGNTEFDDRTDGNFTAGYHTASKKMPHSMNIPPLLTRENSTLSETLPGIRKWIARWQIDAVVCVTGMQDLLSKAGCRIPEDIAVALLNTQEEFQEFAGMDEQGFRTGAAAVDCLVGMIHRGERGIPEAPYQMLIEGKWMGGSTAPPAASRRARVGKVPSR